MIPPYLVLEHRRQIQYNTIQSINPNPIVCQRYLITYLTLSKFSTVLSNQQQISNLGPPRRPFSTQVKLPNSIRGPGGEGGELAK